jgi:hypothetical protein
MERAWRVPLPVQQRPEGLAWCAERGWRLQQAQLWDLVWFSDV